MSEAFAEPHAVEGAGRGVGPEEEEHAAARQEKKAGNRGHLSTSLQKRRQKCGPMAGLG